MEVLLYLACLVVAIVFGIVIFSLVTKRGNKNNETDKAPVEPTIPAKPKKKNWVWPIIIAVVLAFWSIVFALFFLSIVWVMRLDPKTYSRKIPFPSDKDRKRAKGTYTWLLLSPFLNIVVLLIALISSYSSRTSTNVWVIVALAPLIFHLPVLIRLDSNSPFVFRHTQQAILLLALRATTTSIALNIGRYPEDGIWLFLLGNGLLWLFGSLWGRNQAHRGKCWWVKQKGEAVLAKGENFQASDPRQDVQHTPEKCIEYGKWYLKNNQKENARDYSLKAFRLGNSDARSQAVQILSQLGEVEKF